MPSLRIVLVDTLGEILFSGDSLAASRPAVVPASTSANRDDYEDEDQNARNVCPETMRSSESGIYVRAPQAEVVVVEDATAQRESERAA